MRQHICFLYIKTKPKKGLYIKANLAENWLMARVVQTVVFLLYQMITLNHSNQQMHSLPWSRVATLREHPCAVSPHSFSQNHSEVLGVWGLDRKRSLEKQLGGARPWPAAPVCSSVLSTLSCCPLPVTSQHWPSCSPCLAASTSLSPPLPSCSPCS